MGSYKFGRQSLKGGVRIVTVDMEVNKFGW